MALKNMESSEDESDSHSNLEKNSEADQSQKLYEKSFEKEIDEKGESILQEALNDLQSASSNSDKLLVKEEQNLEIDNQND